MKLLKKLILTAGLFMAMPWSVTVMAADNEPKVGDYVGSGSYDEITKAYVDLIKA